MSFYPHLRLFVGAATTVDTAGPHIQVLDTSTGNVLYSTATFPEEQKAAVIKSGPVRCASVDRKFKYLLTSGEDKMLKLWELDGLKLLSERELPKKPTSVAFTADAQTLLVSDKFGDVFSYPFTYVPLTVKQKKDALSSHENPSGGQLILGHASPLNAFLLTPDEKYIITADRDEHIRVSWFPKGYNIEMYCLGHLKFVTAIHIPKSDPSSLISGGGDPMLKIWDWMTGKLKHEVPVLDVIEPFIAVRALKRKRGTGDYEDGDEVPEGGRVKTKKGRGKKGKGKRKEEEKDAAAAVRDGDGEDAGTPIAETADASEPIEEAKPEKVLVIHRIESVDSDAGPYIIFCAVGTTALFAFPYKTNVAASDIRHFDFGRPVLDFYVADDGAIVVNLDGHWSNIAAATASTSSESGFMAKILRLSSGQLSEDSETKKALVDSLNSRSLLPGTSEDLKKLDLYGDLTSMPKYSSDLDLDAEGTGAGQETTTPLPIGAPELSSSSTAAKGKGKAELSKKEIGRMKTKQAVKAKVQELEGAGAGVIRKAGERDEDTDGDGDEPVTKRARSDVGDVAGGGREDVVMS